MIVDSLKIFVTVAEQKNFSKAAHLLHISQPGVSLHIQNLEREFRTKLIHRTSKQVKLTQAGEILYAGAKKMLQIYEGAKQEIDLLQNIVKGTIKIGASYTLGEYLLPRLLAEYTSLYPMVDIEVAIANTEEIMQKVKSNDLDIGLVEGEVQHKDVLSRDFMTDEMILIVPNQHPLASKTHVSIQDLQDQVWVLREQGSGTRAYSDHFLQEYKIGMQRSFVFSSSQGVKEAVAAGLGIAILSHWIVRKEIAHGELHALKWAEKKLERQCMILQKKEAVESKALEIFMQHLAQIADE